MFINDLLEPYLKQKAKASKLVKNLTEKQATMNQQVFIQDIVVRTMGNCYYGEARKHTNDYTHISQTERMIDHIDMLFKLANKTHKVENYEKNDEGELVLKQDRKNHITRLSTPEFSFHTSLPLSTARFNKIVADIEKMAAELAPNINIILGSFGVMAVSGGIINITLCIEGGKPPKIHSVAKNTASDIDINYRVPGRIFSQQRRGMEPSHHAEFIGGKETGAVIGSGSVLEITTLGGARFTQTLDICLDHVYAHSKELLRRRILMDMHPNELIPDQVEQCIISNSIDLQESSRIATTSLHVDPRASMIKDHGADVSEHILDFESVSELEHSKYSQLQFISTDTGYTILNPAFGPDCTVEFLATRPAGQYTPDLKDSVNAQNERVIQRYKERAVAANPYEERFFNITYKTDIILNKFQELESILLDICKPTFWEALLETQDYQLKIAAEKVIRSCVQIIKPHLGKGKEEQIFLLEPWKNDLLLKLQKIDPNPKSPLVHRLTAKMEELLNSELEKEIDDELKKRHTV